MSSGKAKILFIPISGSMLCEMLPIARQIARDGKYQPTFFPQKQYKFNDTHLNLIRDEGFDFFSTPEHSSASFSAKTKEDKPNHRFNQWLSGIFQQIQTHIFPKLLRETIEIYRVFIFQIQEARHFLKTKNVAALALIGDRHIGWETAFIKAANERGAPSMIIPFAMSAPQGNASYRRNQKNYQQTFGVQTRLAKLIALTFPSWVYEYKREKLFFYPVNNAIAAWLAGIMPKNPWLIGGGAATRMAVESQWIKNLYQQQGIPAEKMIITGKPSLDEIAIETQRGNRLSCEMNLSEGTRVVLLAVPQFAEHKMWDWEKHWKEIDFLFATLASLPNTRLVLSLHPSSDPEAYRQCAEKYGAFISRQRYFNLLPDCDVFVAAESSTVMTSIGLCKPTLVLGYYTWHEGIYDNAPGVVVARAHDDVKPAMVRLLNDSSYYAELTASQQKRSRDWILLDGKCTERVVNELYRLIETSKLEDTGKNGK